MSIDERELRTKVLQVDPSKPDINVIDEAAAVIRKGGLVAFPTETVYGLGADALRGCAVSKIFVAKGRPADNPIIVHVSSMDDLSKTTDEVSARAKKLIDRFWPGPLTILFKRKSSVPDITVAGLDTVAVRMPRHAVALSLIRASGTPIAAPSANISGSPSPTTARHVLTDLRGKIELILDGGRTAIGVESTVIDIAHDPPIILRPGGTPVEDIASCIGKVDLHPSVLAEISLSKLLARSPGMKYKHYSPKALLVLVEGTNLARIRTRVQEVADQLKKQGKKKIAIISTSGGTYQADMIRTLGDRRNFEEMAKNLFPLLREVDEEKVDAVVVEGIEPRGLGLAIMNRLRRASGGNIIKV